MRTKQEAIRRLLALLLALSMCFSLFSANVWAADLSGSESVQAESSESEPPETEEDASDAADGSGSEDTDSSDGSASEATDTSDGSASEATDTSDGSASEATDTSDGSASEVTDTSDGSGSKVTDSLDGSGSTSASAEPELEPQEAEGSASAEPELEPQEAEESVVPEEENLEEAIEPMMSYGDDDEETILGYQVRYIAHQSDVNYPTGYTVNYRECRYDANQHKVLSEDKTATDCRKIQGFSEQGRAYRYNYFKWPSGWYAVMDSSVNIDARILVEGDVKLILCDGTTLTTRSIIVKENASLTIYAGSTSSSINKGGKLIAQAKYYATTYGTSSTFQEFRGPGIGMSPDIGSKPGPITIHGGTIEATGYSNAAGIGGGDYAEGPNLGLNPTCSGGSVTIYAGEVTAKGQKSGAGIGGGEGADGKAEGSDDKIRIYGGVVYAECYAQSSSDFAHGAGIGGGGSDSDGRKGCDVYIYGGEVTAIGGDRRSAVVGSGARGIGTGYRPGTSTDESQEGILRVYNNLKVFGATEKNGSMTQVQSEDGKYQRYKHMSILGDNVNYKEASVSGDTVSFTLNNKNEGEYSDVTSDTTALSGGWYAIRTPLDLSGQTLNVSGTVHLILGDTKTAKIGGLRLSDGAVLNVYGQQDGSGKLQLTGSGLTTTSTTAKVFLHGGELSATNTNTDGTGLQCDSVTVYGGTLTATGNGSGAGIGGTAPNRGTLTDYGLIVRGIGGETGEGIAVKSIDLRNGEVYGSRSDSESNLMYIPVQKNDYYRFRLMKLSTASAPAAHTHGASQTGGSQSFATRWDFNDRLPEDAGSYYLNADITLSQDAWTVPTGTTTLCLNGHHITYDGGTIIHVPEGATLNLYDCGTGNTTYFFNDGISTGSHTLNTVVDYLGYVGYFSNGATFKGGYLYLNKTNGISSGSGVIVSGSFNMYGGNIIGFSAEKGGGVNVASTGSFNLYGGRIFGNKATEQGGGVYLEGSMTMSGSASINDNHDGSNKNSNLYLPDGKKLTIGAALTGDQSTGVTMETPGVFTEGWGTQMGNNAGQYRRRFFSDMEPDYVVTKDGDEVTLAVPVAEVVKTNNSIMYRYGSLNDAFNEATGWEKGCILKLVQDVEATETIEVRDITEATHNPALNLNGNTVTMEGTGSVFHINQGAYLRVYGGTIQGGSAEYGGGFLVDGRLVLQTLTITGNNATERGGGVYVSDSGELSVSHALTITGNTSGSGDTAADDNLYLPTGKTIGFDTANDFERTLDRGANIGLSMETPDVFFTSSKMDDTQAGYFHSDDDTFEVFREGNNARLAEKHIHDFTYSVNGAVLTAKCDSTYGTCRLTDKKTTLTIRAPQHTTYGDGKSEAAALDNSTVFAAETQLTLPAIQYEGRNGTSYAKSTTPPAAPGSYTASITLTGVKTGAEESGESVTGDLTASVDYTIAKASPGTPAVTMNGYTYGETPSTPTVGSYSGEGAVTYYYNNTGSTAEGTVWSSSTPPALNQGQYYIYAKIAEMDNYLAYTTAPQSFVVEPRTVGLTWSENKLTYNAQQQLPTATATGLVGEDSCTVTVAPNSDSDTCTTAGSHTAKAASLSNDNYKLPEEVTKTYTIDKKGVTITGVSANNKVYNRSDVADLSGTGELVGVEDGDKVEISIGSGKFEDARAGENKTVTFSGYRIVGDDADNYQLTQQPASVTATIQKLSVSITGLGAKGKTYDGTADAEITGTASIETIMDGDTVTVVAGTAAFSDKNVGENKTVTFSGYSLGGADADNYQLTQQPARATATITARPVTITGISSQDKVYDGTTRAAITGTAVADGLVESDVTKGTVSLDTSKASAAFSDPNVGTPRPVSFSGYALSGTDAGNYTLSQPNSVNETKITKRKVLLIPDALTIVYREAIPYRTVPFTAASVPNTPDSGMVEGESVDVLKAYFIVLDKDDGELTETATPDVGTYQYDMKQDQGMSDNYEVLWDNTRVFTIAQGTATIDAKDEECTYDGKNHKIAVTVKDYLNKQDPRDLIDWSEATVCYSTVSSQDALNTQNTVNPSFRDAGAHTVYYAVALSDNYKGADALTGSQTVTINPKRVGLAWRWNEDEMVYDGQPHAPVLKLTGLLRGDTCEVTVTGEQTNAGTHTATAVSLTNPNYRLPTRHTQSFTIQPREAGVSWSGTTKFTYDGKRHAPSATATGLLPGDTCTVTVTGAQTNAGSYTAAASGLSNGNYRLSDAAEQPFTIEKAPQKAPEKPVVKSVTENSITLNAKAGEEYSLKGTDTWKTDGVFTGLQSGTQYTFLARQAATANLFVSPVSAGTTAVTDTPQTQPSDEDKSKEEAEKKAREEAEQKAKEKRTNALNGGLVVTFTDDGIDIAWGKVSGATAYEVWVQYCGKDFPDKPTKTVKASSKRKVTIRKLNGSKLSMTRNCRVVVKARKDEKQLAESIEAHVVGKENKKYTNAKKIALEKTAYTLSVGKTAKIKAKTVLVDAKKKQLGNKHAREFRYASSDKSVATVSKSGKITAKGKGRCKVYVYARNGLSRKVKVTVK